MPKRPKPEAAQEAGEVEQHGAKCISSVSSTLDRPTHQICKHVWLDVTVNQIGRWHHTDSLNMLQAVDLDLQ